MYFFRKGAVKAMDFLGMIYNAIYYVGIQTLRYGKRFFRWLLSLLLKPVKAFTTLIFTLVVVINKHALSTFHKSVDEFKNLVDDAKKVFSHKRIIGILLKVFAHRRLMLPDLMPFRMPKR